MILSRSQHSRLDCLRRERQSAAAYPACRKIIAEAVAGNPDTYTEGFLGKPNGEYCAWIQDSQRWGGGIELSILSECAASSKSCVLQGCPRVALDADRSVRELRINI